MVPEKEPKKNKNINHRSSFMLPTCRNETYFTLYVWCVKEKNKISNIKCDILRKIQPFRFENEMNNLYQDEILLIIL